MFSVTSLPPPPPFGSLNPPGEPLSPPLGTAGVFGGFPGTHAGGGCSQKNEQTISPRFRGRKAPPCIFNSVWQTFVVHLLPAGQGQVLGERRHGQHVGLGICTNRSHLEWVGTRGSGNLEGRRGRPTDDWGTGSSQSVGAGRPRGGQRGRQVVWLGRYAGFSDARLRSGQ